jgi:hypothetical protein
MAIHRVIIELDLGVISFSALNRATGAIAVLEEMAEGGQAGLKMQVLGPQRESTRKRRSDALQPEESPDLHPQAKIVLEALTMMTQPVTAGELAENAGLKESSVRPQLHVLAGKGLAHQTDELKVVPGRRSAIFWIAGPKRKAETVQIIQGPGGVDACDSL